MAEEMHKFKSTVTKVGSIKHVPAPTNAVISPGQASIATISVVGDRKHPSKKIVLRLIEFFKQ